MTLFTWDERKHARELRTILQASGTTVCDEQAAPHTSASCLPPPASRPNTLVGLIVGYYDSLSSRFALIPLPPVVPPPADLPPALCPSPAPRACYCLYLCWSGTAREELTARWRLAFLVRNDMS